MVATAAACTAAALVLAPSTAAFAADVSWEGDENVAWNLAGNWAGGTVPQFGDALFFPVVGVHGFSDNNIANPFFADRLEVTGDDVNIAGWTIVTAPAAGVGIRIAAQDVTISPELRLNGNQTISVEAGASVTFPSNIRIESGLATLDIEGTASIGQLDGVGFVGGAEKTGAGVLTISGAGGISGGLSVLEGTVFLVGNGAGTAWNLADGASITGYGQMERLLAEDGRLAPGDAADGSGIDTLEIWNQFTATDETVLDLELLANGSSDSIATLEGTAVDGAVLDLALEAGTLPGTTWEILEQERDSAFSWTFTTPDGAAIVEGEEFVSNGQLYTLETVGRTVVVTYVGPAPTPSPSPVPVLSATGSDGASMLPGILIAGGALVLGAIALVLVQVQRRRGTPSE
jgi:autotransporter-associated beta strand protein